MKPLAHSAYPKKGIKAQLYEDHILGVLNRARENALQMLKYCHEKNKNNLMDIVVWAAYYHDLGKLDVENQEVLSGIKKARHLPINHVDAGVACLMGIEKKLESALLVLSHHRGIPSISGELAQQYPFRDINIMEKTNTNLNYYLCVHKNEVNISLDTLKQSAIPDGLLRRLTLSCLVDADYGDTGHYIKPVFQTRWKERLEKLDTFVKAAYEENSKNQRNELRNKIYFACRNKKNENSVYFCDSPVGTGKTTAIMAHMLKVAIEKDLRHIFVVLPFTNIITQSVKTYRQALVLDGEDPETIVAEHDHQADFSTMEARELATLWNAPIIVTTAVQFFETLGSNRPSNIRKLHELPGTGIFVDESHAAIPTWLWPQAWLWLEKLIVNWNCHLILASGTSVKFWEIENFIKNKVSIPQLIPQEIRNEAEVYEQKRVDLKVTFNNMDKIVNLKI
jgi:CRISPR-associated endonuclease/helicase Cas3